MVEIKLNNKVVSKSQSLRGILEYARNKAIVREATCYRATDDALIAINFDNGAECRTRFADYSVAVDWVRSRRSWGLSERYHSHDVANFFLPYRPIEEPK